MEFSKDIRKTIYSWEEVEKLLKRIAELELEVKAMDRVWQLMDDYEPWICALCIHITDKTCTYHTASNKKCRDGMIAHAKAKIEKEWKDV